MATLYVTQSGAGSGNGSTLGNAMSVATHNSNTFSGGDIIYVSGTITSQLVPPSDGSSGNVITYDDYGDASFEGPYLGGAIIDLTNRSYITVQNLTIDGQGYFTNSQIKNAVKLSNTTYCRLLSLTITRIRGYDAITLTNSHYNEIYGCDLSYSGWWNKQELNPTDDQGDYGNLISFDTYNQPASKHNYIHGNTIAYAGHSPVKPGFASDNARTFNIFKDNVFTTNIFTTYTGSSYTTGVQSYVETGDQVGNRCAEFGDAIGWLLENNMFMNSTISTDDRWQHTIKLGGHHNIFRMNFLINSYGPMINITTSEATNPYRTTNGYNRVYNNAFYNSGGPIIRTEKNNSNGNNSDNNVFKNNLAKYFNQVTQYDKRDSYLAGSPSTKRNTMFEWYGGNKNYSDNWSGLEFSGNCVCSGDTASNQTVYSDVSGAISLTTAESSYAAYFHDNIQADPAITTEPPTARTHFDLQAGSACINSGDDLTTVTSATGSGTSVQVADARYFVDPTNWYWVGTGDVAADEIQIGTNDANRATLTDIDYDTNTLYFDASLSWTTDDGVNPSQFMENSNTQPDIGPRPYGGTVAVTANNDIYNTTKNASQADIDVLDNDSGSGTLTITSVSYSAGNGSTVAVKAGSLFVEYTPGTDFVGSEQFTYTISNGTDSDTGTVTVNVADTSGTAKFGDIIDNGDAGNSTTGDFSTESTLSGKYGSDYDTVGEYTP